MGVQRYSETDELLIKAHDGGRNSYPIKLWKIEFQILSKELRSHI